VRIQLEFGHGIGRQAKPLAGRMISSPHTPPVSMQMWSRLCRIWN